MGTRKLSEINLSISLIGSVARIPSNPTPALFINPYKLCLSNTSKTLSKSLSSRRSASICSKFLLSFFTFSIKLFEFLEIPITKNLFLSKLFVIDFPIPLLHPVNIIFSFTFL